MFQSNVQRPLRLIACCERSRRMKGLSGRRKLHPDAGIWLAPCRAIQTFTMKMKIDVAFLDAEGRVIRVLRHMPAGRIAFCRGAHSVAEFGAGSIGFGEPALARIESAVAMLRQPSQHSVDTAR